MIVAATQGDGYFTDEPNVICDRIAVFINLFSTPSLHAQCSSVVKRIEYTASLIIRQT